MMRFIQETKQYLAPTLIILILFFANPLYNQELNFQDYKNKHPKDQGVIISKEIHSNIVMEDNKPVVYMEYYQKILFLAEDNVGVGYDYIYYSNEIELLESKASYITPEGKTVKVKDYYDEDYVSDYEFYSDSKRRKIRYPAYEVGGAITVYYKMKINNPIYWNSENLIMDYPTESFLYTINAPNNVHIKHLLLHCDTNFLQLSIEKKGKNNIFTFIGKDFPDHSVQEYAPNYRYYTPTLFTSIENYSNKKGELIPVVESTRSLFDFLKARYYKCKNESNEEMQQIADSLTADCTSEIEKVQAIASWVQKNIRYLFYSDGENGVVPQPAQEVFASRHGDCKGKSNLFIELLKLIDIKAYYCWISSRENPYSLSDFPGTPIFNHIICNYIDPNGKDYFIDLTAEYSPIDRPNENLQGKETIVLIDSTQFQVKTIPTAAAHINVQSTKTELKFEENQLIGKGEENYYGYPAEAIFGTLDYLNYDIKEMEEAWNEHFTKGNDKAIFSNLTYTCNKNELDSVKINYDLKIPDHVIIVDDHLYVNLVLEGGMGMTKVKLNERTAGISFNYHLSENHIVDFEIPEGYTIEFLPKKSSYKTTLFDYDLSYQQLGNRIICTLIINSQVLELPLESLPEWNRYVQQFQRAVRQTISLKKQ